MKVNYMKLTAGVITGVMAVSSATGVEATVPTAGVTSFTEDVVDSSSNPTAGFSAAVLDMTDKDRTVVAETDVTENGADKVKSEYADIAIAQVNDYVNVRSEANENSEVLGKLYNNSAATVLETTDGGWYKIQSGSVTGYVKCEFVVVGDEAVAKNAGRRVATVTTETLRVRTSSSTDASVLTQVGLQEDLTVVDESVEGWVGVSTSEGNGYVSSEFVTVATEYTYAESKEEEEARLAAEQAKREAEERAAREAEEAEAAQRAERRQSSSNKSSSSKSESKSENKSSSSKSYNAPSGSSGQAVADYACQFVGNPYVYGGTSLTNGTDCSGFVMGVYGAFGVSLPHSSSALRSVGYEVSQSDMRPGDIVCYSGHVGIYCGNNTIVHASNPSSGIKYTSPANYRSIITVRRIF